MINIQNPELRQMFTQLRDIKMQQLTQLQQEIGKLMPKQWKGEILKTRCFGFGGEEKLHYKKARENDVDFSCFLHLIVEICLACTKFAFFALDP